MDKPMTRRGVTNNRQAVQELSAKVLLLPPVQISITEGVRIPQWIKESGYARWTVETKHTTYTLLVIHGGLARFRGGLVLVKLPMIRNAYRMAFPGPCDVLKIVGPTGHCYQNYRLCENCFRNTPDADPHRSKNGKWNVNFTCSHCPEEWCVSDTDWTVHKPMPKHHHHQASPR